MSTLTASETEASASAEWQARQAKKQPAPAKKQQDPNPVPDAALEIAVSPDFGAVELGIEGLTSTQTLGNFRPPEGFDMEKYATAWGCVEPGSVPGFPSVAELCQPKLHAEIRATFPGFRAYTNPVTGKPHEFVMGRGVLRMVWTLRENVDRINRAFAEYSKNRLKLTDLQIRKTELVLPEAARQAARNEEDALAAEIEALQQAISAT